MFLGVLMNLSMLVIKTTRWKRCDQCSRTISLMAYFGNRLVDSKEKKPRLLSAARDKQIEII